MLDAGQVVSDGQGRYKATAERTLKVKAVAKKQ